MNKKRCPFCSDCLRKNGRDAKGKQRWLCPSCGRSSRWRNKATNWQENEWFRLWVVEGYSARQLANQSEYSLRKLYRMINDQLKKEVPSPVLSLGQYRHFIFDGTFLHRPHGLVALMDACTHTLVAGKYGVSESSQPQLELFFEYLISAGLKPTSFTVDGNPNVIKVLRKLWPEITIQRCLVHIQRQGLSWCRSFPKTTYASKLRKIFHQVTRIHTLADRDKFLEAVIEWESKYGTMINDRHETGYVFSDIKRARSMLIRALPDMFHYLDDPLIPISTNGLEGYFSRLKNHYRQHRGLRKEKRPDYFRWYFYYVPK